MGCCVFTRRKAYEQNVNISVIDRIVTFRLKTKAPADSSPVAKAREPTTVDIIKVPMREHEALTETSLAAHSVGTTSKT